LLTIIGVVVKVDLQNNKGEREKDREAPSCSSQLRFPLRKPAQNILSEFIESS